MRTIAELSLLLREQTDLPAGLKVSTDEFREGWSFIKRTDARRLEKRILKSGWKYFRIEAGALRSGVGETSQQAIANALDLGLRKVGTHFNAVELDQIEVTRYPWFFLAKIRIFPCRIQEEARFAMPEAELNFPADAEAKGVPKGAAEPFPGFGGAMPLLKKMIARSPAVEVAR
jgi:hypothetical protein